MYRVTVCSGALYSRFMVNEFIAYRCFWGLCFPSWVLQKLSCTVYHNAAFVCI